MKKLFFSFLIVAAAGNVTAQDSTAQCKAKTQAHGKQCLRKATKDGYCTQHFKMVETGRKVKTV